MITLSAFGPLWGVPDPSPFVMKTQVQLKMAGLDYQTARFRPPEAPKGKLPFIDDDGERVALSGSVGKDHQHRTDRHVRQQRDEQPV